MPTSQRSREMWNRNARSPDAGGRPSQIRSRSALGVDRGARLEGEQGEQGASQRRARRVDHTVVIDHIDRPEQADCWHRHPLAVDPGFDVTRTSMTTAWDQSVAAVIASSTASAKPVPCSSDDPFVMNATASFTANPNAAPSSRIDAL